jgi:hypothetical protein
MGLAAQGYGGYYGEPTQHQYTMQQQQQQQYTYEEYAHYPHPEEYMNERNRAYFHHNGEQYAMPTKQQQRHRLDSDCKYYLTTSIISVCFCLLESLRYRNSKFSHYWKFPAALHRPFLLVYLQYVKILYLVR